MPTTPTFPIDLSPEPDLHPLYPTITQISEQISADSGLNPSQKAELVAHCLTRACAFGDISLVQYLLTDRQAQAHVDLELHDEDGVGLVSLAIYGFRGDSDRDMEREECVRLLVSQGADLNADQGRQILTLFRLFQLKQFVVDESRLDSFTLCCDPCSPNSCVVFNDPWLLSFCTYREEAYTPRHRYGAFRAARERRCRIIARGINANPRLDGGTNGREAEVIGKAHEKERKTEGDTGRYWEGPGS